MIILATVSSSLFAAIITLTICHFYYNNEITILKKHYYSAIDDTVIDAYRSGKFHGMADATIENMGPISEDTFVYPLVTY